MKKSVICLTLILAVILSPCGCAGKGGPVLLLLPHFGDGQVALLLPGHLLLTAFQLFFKFPVPHLLHDLCVTGFIHLKNLPAVGAFDLLHRFLSPLSMGKRRFNAEFGMRNAEFRKSLTRFD